ncbi:hypothetical protein [Natrinema saccharevitans]|uniref:hypothetical protein n=1 Tax=Natrinema saccharevitans TaxID=301967 RepID=UPI00158BBA14|nr:hypothetical protein [Natrinema saccharevitans]
MSCYTSALHEGAKYYERGSRALEDGDSRQANEYFQQSQQELNRCESSDRSLSLR